VTRDTESCIDDPALIEDRSITDSELDTPDLFPEGSRERRGRESEQFDIVAGTHAVVEQAGVAESAGRIAEQYLKDPAPVAQRFVIYGHRDCLDDGWTEPRVVHEDLCALAAGERPDLEIRPHLGAIVRPLKRCLVDADGERRQADDERRDGDEGLWLAVPRAIVGHGRPMSDDVLLSSRASHDTRRSATFTAP